MRCLRPAAARAAPAVALAALLSACSGGGVAAPAGASRGTPRGPSITRTVDASGGSFTSDDGLLTVTVPAGAVTAPTDFSITAITNTAPAALGSGYRLGPAGLALVAPVTLAFSLSGAGLPVEQLAVSYQDGSGFWLRAPGAVKAAQPAAITAVSFHLADWAAGAATSTRDLSGPVTYQQTLDTPFAAAGRAALTFAGEDTGEYYYFSAIDLAVAPVAVGATTCSAAAPDDPGRTSLVQLFKSPPDFSFALNAEWHLDCADSSAVFVATQFDTFGVNLYSCKRRYEGVPIATPDHLQGAFVIDCGARGYVRATWNLTH